MKSNDIVTALSASASRHCGSQLLRLEHLILDWELGADFPNLQNATVQMSRPVSKRNIKGLLHDQTCLTDISDKRVWQTCLSV